MNRAAAAFSPPSANSHSAFSMRGLPAIVDPRGMVEEIYERYSVGGR
jgi:hypothetical protein